MVEDSAAQDALDRLAEALAGSKFRGELRQDPEAAAKVKGIDVDALPAELLATLGSMTDEELKIVGLVQRQLNGQFRDSPSVAILF